MDDLIIYIILIGVAFTAAILFASLVTLCYLRRGKSYFNDHSIIPANKNVIYISGILDIKFSEKNIDYLDNI